MTDAQTGPEHTSADLAVWEQAHRFAPWVIQMAGAQVPIYITTADGDTTTGVVTGVLTARAAGAPKGDDWARFVIGDRVISAAEITAVGYLQHENAR